MKEDKILQQNIDEKDNPPGAVFLMHLLMEEMCEMPDKEVMVECMRSHLGEVDCFCHDDKVVGFAPKQYVAHFEQGDIPPQLMVMGCTECNQPILDGLDATQTWDCPDSQEILAKCKYQVVAVDMLAAAMDYKERAKMLVEYIEALMEIYPSCKAIVFGNSKKMFTRDAILNCNVPQKNKFIYYAVNVRFFNIQGTNDMLIDSVGMSTLFLPDVQYHFHGLNPNDVVNHAYNVLTYIFDENNPIESNDHIDGLKNRKMSKEVQWKVQYENALIQPVREVIDFNTGEYAAGGR